MWKFWAVLILLMLGAGVYALMAGRPGQSEVLVARAPDTAAPVESAPAPPPVTEKPATQPAPREVERPEPVTPAAPEPATPRTNEQPELAPMEPAPAPVPAEPEPVTEPSVEEAPAAAPHDSFDELIPNEDGIPPAEQLPEVADATPLQKFGDFEVLPARIEKREDGSLLLDGKYILRGEGTPQNPYVLTWDLLVSVEEAFDPQNGRRRLPERVTMLDGRHARISGYVAFPMTDREPRELLSMLNQWDGCCIGTPPTPYDAIEVALREPVVGDDRFATSGRVSGVFHVKPYLQGDWLIGLYVMDDATLTPRDFGGEAAN